MKLLVALRIEIEKVRIATDARSVWRRILFKPTPEDLGLAGFAGLSRVTHAVIEGILPDSLNKFDLSLDGYNMVGLFALHSSNGVHTCSCDNFSLDEGDLSVSPLP